MSLLFTRLGWPHLYISFAGYVCYAYRRGRTWHTGILINRKLWRER